MHKNKILEEKYSQRLQRFAGVGDGAVKMPEAFSQHHPLPPRANSEWTFPLLPNDMPPLCLPGNKSVGAYVSSASEVQIEARSAFDAKGLGCVSILDGNQEIAGAVG